MLPSWVSSMCYQANARLGWKCLLGTNPLAYYENLNLTRVKSFIRVTPRANVIKLFMVVSYNFNNKIERLSLASLSSLV
jgi:hypothetical protein